MKIKFSLLSVGLIGIVVGMASAKDVPWDKADPVTFIKTTLPEVFKPVKFSGNPSAQRGEEKPTQTLACRLITDADHQIRIERYRNLRTTVMFINTDWSSYGTPQELEKSSMQPRNASVRFIPSGGNIDGNNWFIDVPVQLLNRKTALGTVIEAHADDSAPPSVYDCMSRLGGEKEPVIEEAKLQDFAGLYTPDPVSPNISQNCHVNLDVSYADMPKETVVVKASPVSMLENWTKETTFSSINDSPACAKDKAGNVSCEQHTLVSRELGKIHTQTDLMITETFNLSPDRNTLQWEVYEWEGSINNPETGIMADCTFRRK